MELWVRLLGDQQRPPFFSYDEQNLSTL